MDAGLDPLPDDLEALKAALAAERDRRILAEADAAAAKATSSAEQALIVHLKLQIAKLRREIFGPRSERTARLLDQMELQLEELEATATEGGRDRRRTARSEGQTLKRRRVHPPASLAQAVSRPSAARARGD